MLFERLDAALSGHDSVDAAGVESLATGSVNVLRSERLLQDVPDYRAAIQAWFAKLAPYGHLIITVPHAFLYERELTLPSRWRRETRRLYTPASLLQEVEEALVPNSYRVRWLGDVDRGYDYDAPITLEPLTGSDVAIVLERIMQPGWSLDQDRTASEYKPATAADFSFEPARTRVEMNARLPVRRVLILKLDHLGDFIMGLPALERARSYFADATIDLAVGRWNAKMARGLNIADRVIEFDAFPRNSTEQEPNVEATLNQFRAQVTDDYDLAIDLRTDVDTRTLLRAAKATIKAGIGTRSRFPYLDIALPLDGTRNAAENARDDNITHAAFVSQGSARRRHFSIRSERESIERDCAIVWGPYFNLSPGDYIFDFYLDLDDHRSDGLLKLDVALAKGETAAEMFVSGPSTFQLPFRVDEPNTTFEARIWAVDGHPTISFNFYGGRLLKRSPGNVLHQSEYALLLIEHVKMRIQDLGSLTEVVRG